jgi:hypothetical protein
LLQEIASSLTTFAREIRVAMTKRRKIYEHDNG